MQLAGEIDVESTRWFAEIKSNLGRAIALRELRPGIVTWISRLNKYIRMYGYKFPKADHITLIKLLLGFITSEGLEPFIVHHIAGALNSLLKKKDLLTREDLVIEWKPLYLLYERLFHKNLESLGLIKMPNNIGPSMGALIKNCRTYFPIESTEVMVVHSRNTFIVNE